MGSVASETTAATHAVSVRVHTDFPSGPISRQVPARSRRLRRIAGPFAWYDLFGLQRLLLPFLLLLAAHTARAPAAFAQVERFAVIQFRGDLDARHTADAFVEALRALDHQRPGLILIELTGNRTRPDLLFECVRAVRDCETPIAVWLADPADRRVAPGMLGLALAADHRALHAATAIERARDDDTTALNPDVEDWAVIRLDLRALARDLAESGPLDRLIYESALAPRAPLWAVRDENGAPVLIADEPAGQTPPIIDKNADGWTFNATPQTASRLYALPVHRTRRALERTLGLRGRPAETIELESGLTEAHARARTLIDRVRDAVRLADATLDVRAGRSATSRVMPHEYHAAASKAKPLVEQSRAAIAEIATLSETYPELLQIDPPEDADAPTELGGPVRTPMSAWRTAVRDAEYDLRRLDDRIATYERR